MNTTAVISNDPSSRAKACTECRQHKLRCDANKETNQSCSRCRRRGLQCVRSANFKRVKRKTKAQLQAEIERLKSKAHSPSDQDGPINLNLETTVQSMSDDFHDSASIDTGTTYSPNVGRAEFQRQSYDGNAISMLHPIPTSNFDMSGIGNNQATQPALSRKLNELDVDGIEIDDCFALFYNRYAHQFPILQHHVDPNTCYSQSPFLFWTIVATGARRYARNPILISLLAPELEDLAKLALFTREGALYTLQAIILLLVWPMPVDTLSKELGPMFIGAALQLALSIGLHVYGVGQDFSRIKIASDRAQMDYRARLWAILITVCQRSNCTDGIPPVSIPDTQGHVYCKKDIAVAIPQTVRFEKELSAIQVEAILEIERNALSKLPQDRSAILNSIIDSATSKFERLRQENIDLLRQFYVMCAELQISQFYLFAARSAIQDENLIKVYDLACSAVEIMMQLEDLQKFSDAAPLFVSKYLHLTAFTILKLSRCHIKDSLDVNRGRNAYYFTINYNRNASVVTGDLCSRACTILSQLWTSKKIFRRSDGSLDSLSLRCGSRLAMSPAFDAYWWWRSEFGGKENPYDDKGGDKTENAISGPNNEITIQPVNTDFYNYAPRTWSLDGILTASQWPMAGEIMPVDWSNLDLGLDTDLSGMPLSGHLSDMTPSMGQAFT